jgi:hypothetical protein
MRSIWAQPIPARAVALSGVAALIVSLVALVAPVSADPPGNNGTVKIDGVPFDDHPNNEPHPGCVFQVDFYGYDAGALFASVTFEHWNPTGDGHGDVLLHEEGIWIGEDDHSGGGSEAGLDASRTYDLSAQLAGMEPHPQQGFHIKLTVHADGSQGADVKHKVFWVECLGNGGGGGEQGQVLLQKVDQTGAGKAGAVFTLTGVTDASFSATATTSATGSAGFSALVAGTYSLAETTPPAGCTGFVGSITITVEADGDVTVGTLPAGVTFAAGTVRVVNNCGGGLAGGGGGSQSGSGTLAGGGGPAVGALPNTRTDGPEVGAPTSALGFLAVLSLAILLSARLAESRIRR